MPDPSYPDELLYHPEHDWARVSDDEATFGITWYAQDALGEGVFFAKGPLDITANVLAVLAAKPASLPSGTPSGPATKAPAGSIPPAKTPAGK